MLNERRGCGGEEATMDRGGSQRVLVLLAAVSLLVLVGACGGGGSKSTNSGTTNEVAPSSASSGKDVVGAVSNSGGASSAQPAATSASSSTTTSDWDRKIIRNADISLKVTNVESMLAIVRNITDGAGGVVFASSTSFDGDDQIATMTLDVPADQFDQVVNSLRSAPGVKKVEKEAISSQDVTDEYVDLQSQLHNLQTTQTRLLALMDQATQLQDILTIEQELSKVEGQIDQTTGRINYLDKRTSYSRITLTLTPFAVSANNESSSGSSFSQAVHDAWAASLRFTGGILTGVVKAFVFLWWFWPLVAIAAGVVFVRRQRRRPTNGNSEVAV
jgi:hypothetical protein